MEKKIKKSLIKLKKAKISRTQFSKYFTPRKVNKEVVRNFKTFYRFISTKRILRSNRVSTVVDK